MKKTILFLSLCIGLMRCGTDQEPALGTGCGTPATVVNLAGLDGCGYVFQLEDGSYIEPVMPFFCGTPPVPQEQLNDPLYQFEWEDGKKVRIDYEVEQDLGSYCMVGTVARITCISSGTVVTEDK